MPKLTRKEKAEITKQKIINAARELNHEKVIQDITVDDITNKAGVSKGSFYTYFKEKEDVVEQFMFENWKELREKVIKMNGSLEEKVDYYVTQFALLIEEKGKETCRGWVASRVSKDTKLLFDEETLNLILNDEKKARCITAFLYGLMLSWAMSNDERTLVSLTNDAKDLILKSVNID